MALVDLTLRIAVDRRIFDNEYSYYYGNLSSAKVKFIYVRKTGEETERTMTYFKALNLAMSRSRDGRYKNYDFVISL